ncbi:MAG TPA: SH3 domain-containing protein [Herpetosiphonaceae bacterium]|nr:SH3 domain-containing protein [Herpetosiphonaceae bacterium]
MSSQYYEQGRHDAEHGTLNQLFYHTYHDYKRGYDEVMRGKPRRRAPTSLLVAALLVAGVGAGWFLRDRGLFGAQPTAVIVVVTPTVAVPTPTFPFVIATPAPPTATAPAEPGLRPGGRAEVATDGGALRVRPNPGTAGEPLAALPNGSAVTIIEGPSEGDGYTWWKIEIEGGSGWVVADFLRPLP